MLSCSHTAKAHMDIFFRLEQQICNWQWAQRPCQYTYYWVRFAEWQFIRQVTHTQSEWYWAKLSKDRFCLTFPVYEQSLNQAESVKVKLIVWSEFKRFSSFFGYFFWFSFVFSWICFIVSLDLFYFPRFAQLFTGIPSFVAFSMNSHVLWLFLGFFHRFESFFWGFPSFSAFFC